MFRKSIVVGAALSAAMLMAQPLAAAEFVYGSWVAAKHGVNTAGLEPFFKAVEKDTGGAVKWRLLAGGQLVSARSTLPGVRDRIVDAGLIIPVFARKALANGNVLFDMQPYGSNAAAIAGASTETIMLDCPECQAEYKKNKTVYLGGFGTTAFKMMCSKPITTVAQMKGVKTRAVGAAARWVKLLGGIPVAMSPVDGVTAMQRGALTCLHGPVPWLVSYGYMDVVKSIINYPMGTPRGLALLAMNRKSWDSISTAHKKVMFKHLPLASARATMIGYVAEDARILKVAKAKGILIVPGGKEFADLMAKHRISEMTAIPKGLAKVKVKEATAKRIMASFLGKLKKWEGLMATAGGDVNKVAAAFKSEIYDKLDPATY